jgi:hypothetical protein
MTLVEIKANPNKNYNDNFYFRRTKECRVGGVLGSADDENKVFASFKHLLEVIQHFKSSRW